MITIDMINTGGLASGTLDTLDTMAVVVIMSMVVMMMAMIVMLITRFREAHPAILLGGSEDAALGERIRKALAGVGHGW
jgi:hypothetical protein